MWIYEKFYSWTDNNGSPEDALSREQMLDDISLYSVHKHRGILSADLFESHLLERGGHFAAFEQPDIFVEEIRSAFRKLRDQ